MKIIFFIFFLSTSSFSAGNSCTMATEASDCNVAAGERCAALSNTICDGCQNASASAQLPAFTKINENITVDAVVRAGGCTCPGLSKNSQSYNVDKIPYTFNFHGQKLTIDKLPSPATNFPPFSYREAKYRSVTEYKCVN